MFKFSAKRCLVPVGLIASAMLSTNILAATPPRATPVHSLVLSQQDIPLKYEFAARTAAAQSIDLQARVQGTLLKQHYRDGAEVKAGQLLFEIDPERYQATVEQAEAEVDRQQANVRQAERDWNRVSQLFKQRAISERERDESRSTLELAKAGLRVAQAALKTARIDLGHTQVKATIDGTAGDRQQDIGSLVGSSSANSLLTTITQLDPIDVQFSIPDEAYLKLRQLIAAGRLAMPADNKVAAKVILSPGNPYNQDGYVDFTDSKVDVKTGTVPSRATFPNPDQLLLPGQFVRVQMTGLSLLNAVAIPQKAVLQMGLQPFVYVIENDKATLRPVKLGVTVGDKWIIESGLKSGERIVLDNLVKVRPDATVSLLPDQPQTGNAEAR